MDKIVIGQKIMDKFQVVEFAFINISFITQIEDVYRKAIDVIAFISGNSDIVNYSKKRFVYTCNKIMRLYLIANTEDVVMIRKNNKDPAIYLYNRLLFADNNISSDYIMEIIESFEYYLDKILKFKNDYTALENIFISKDRMKSFLLKYPYIMVAHKLFDENSYIYSGGERNEYLMHNKIYDENDDLFEDFDSKVETYTASKIHPISYKVETVSKYCGLRNMTDSWWDDGWKILGFVKDEEGNIL